MSKDAALAKGVWLPRWFLALLSGLMVPLIIAAVIGVFNMRENQIRAEERQVAGQHETQQAIGSLKDTLEYRLRNIETQGKLNDEHGRQLENRIARVEGRKGISQ